MKKKTLVVANWKMNPSTLEEARKIAQATKRTASQLRKTQVVVASSFVHLSPLAKLFERNNKLALGAQNMHWKDSGAHTGEISVYQLRDLKVKYVILGHSEVRATGTGETDEVVNMKLRTALSQGLTPILCIGEKERDREGDYLQFVKKQLTECLRDVQKKDLLDVIIAYEPVWAIGRSYRESMTATDMHEMSLFIKKILSDFFGPDYSGLTLLYGGSVESENALELMQKGDVDGFLVGHASLVPEELKKILKAVDTIK